MGKRPETPDTDRPTPTGPTSFLAAATALAAIDDAVHAARTTDATGTADADTTGPQPALAALVLLRELRTELAGWEAALVETARAEGATWADLARPMGVASRQAAENRYLRLRPSHTTRQTDEETGAERVKAVRDRRAADRAVTAWARDHAADLRILAARITASEDIAAAGNPTLTALTAALGTSDAADLIAPLTDIRPHLGTAHPDIAARLDDLTRRTDRLRHDSDQQRA
ncbi:type III effector protein [Kitasatospora sp. NPDC048365]|uniref:type III effector protein n=1 Tax=Kitasatospora sp. NPDC048365 TaxID=3364050 RepID=UPI0037130CC0